MDSLDITLNCKVEKHGGWTKLVPNEYYWKEWNGSISFCVHGEKLRWYCDECGEIFDEYIGD